jgi:hypothetical protein
MKHIQKFKKFFENTAPAPVKPMPGKPTTVPTRPEKPQKPVKPFKPIVRPSVDPEPKAEVTEMDVAERFIKELNKKGESVKKYL